MKVEIYVDASFSDNRSLAGYGAIIIRNGKKIEVSGIIKGAKNSTEAEIFGVYEILEILDDSDSIIIYNDNMACVDIINGGKLNKKNSKINKAISIIRKHKGKIKGVWVRGHDVCKNNCIADSLARAQLMKIEINDFEKFEINIYIGVQSKKQRIGYSYIVELNNEKRILYSDLNNLRNGGIETYSYIVSKVLGKPFSNHGHKITHLNIISNSRQVLSLFNLIIRGQKKDYGKILRSNIEDKMFKMLRNVKIHVNKDLKNEKLNTVIENAKYALEN